jgi:DNA polymerase elongation subunit (family B)
MEFPRKDPPSLDDNVDLQFQITDWYIPESDRSRPKPENPEEAEFYTMVIYGTTENGNTVSARITDFEPYFFVKPPESWEKYSETRFKNEIQELERVVTEDKYPCVYNGSTYKKKIIPNGYDKHFTNISIAKRKDFWGFTNNTDFRFIKVCVKSLYLYNNLKYYFESRKKEGFVMYESNIDPFLRYIHIKDIKPCGWISITGFTEEDNDNYITRCDYNIVSNFQKVSPITINNNAPFLIVSFDIECMSSHGDFPVPKKDYRKVAQDMAIVAKAGYDITPEILLYWFETIYTSDAIIDDDIKINKVYPKNSVDDNKISIIKEKVKAESDRIISILNEISNSSAIASDSGGEDDEDVVPAAKMTLKQQNVLECKINNILTKILPPLKGDKIIQIGTTVHRYGSDEIIYKNILSLNSCDDIEGADVVSCKTEKLLLMQWKNLISRLNPDILTGYNIFGFDMEYIWMRVMENNIVDDFSKGLGRNLTKKSSLIRQELSSSALGDNILNYFDLDGTVSIDVFKVMQRDHKLDSYKLDNVAQVFLGDKKADLKPHEIFEKFKGSSKDRCVIAEYCIQDCALVNRLLHKLKILENNIGMGNVCLVPLNYLFRRGQGIKIFSLVAKQCMDKGFLIPVMKYSNTPNKEDIDGYEGAVVLDPKEGLYLNDPIVVFDYGSLYPSSMIARNLSHDCYVMNPKYKVDDPNVYYITVSYDIYEGIGDKKHKVGVKECEFAQYRDGKKGVISDILCMLLQERKNTRKKMEYETVTTVDSKFSGIVSEIDDTYEIKDIETNMKTIVKKSDAISKCDTYNKFEQDVFDALQIAYKITANSLYGQLGAKTSQIYMKDIAACTTATGREMIMIAKEFVEKNYDAEVIYGDTDSIFCKFPLKDENGNPVYGKESLKYAIEVGKDVEKSIVSIMPSPQKLNYEKSMYPFILFSKKRYVGNLYEMDTTKFKQKSMGIVLKRRDNAYIVKKIYGGIIDILLNNQDLHESIEFLKEELTHLVQGKAPITDLIISKSIRANYKDATKIPHKVLADRIGERDPGNKPQVNDRIPFVYIKVPDAKLQGDRIENPDYIVENNLTPDYLHYITNQIMNPVLQLYALCLNELPNYDKSDEYWNEIEEELKKKPIYQDDVKRKKRLDNLKLQMVKYLLFSEFIDMLTEPKVSKKKASSAKITTGDDIVDKKPRKVSKKAGDTDSALSEISSDTSGMLSGEIKVIKKTETKKIETTGKIMEGKKIVWKYTNTEGKDKTYEIINTICAMVVFGKTCGKKIAIKVNFKEFVTSYCNSLINYETYKKDIGSDKNTIKEAIENQDVGIMKNVGSIIKYEELMNISDHFIIRR